MRHHRKRYKKLAIFIPLIILLLIGYEIHQAVYPPDTFYIEDFEKYSGIKFPPSGIILEKFSTYPDQHGKYISAALIKLSESDFQDLKNKLKLSPSAERDTTEHPIYGNTLQFLNSQKDFEINDFNTIYDIHGLKLMVIAFNKDGKTILYEKKI